MSPPTPDPFGVEQLRGAVLDSWRASPTRFREDANVEEDYALGAYRDRLVVELAQNASDAARAAGVPGRLLLTLDDTALTAANVGVPLDRAGVQSLAAMRASSKSEGAVGRFGVGFAAVLAVSDAPEIRSRHGGVRFDRSATRELLLADPELSTLVENRPPPVLRLPFPAEDAPPDGYDTAVVLPWRDEAARQLAVAAVDAIDEVLLLALDQLESVVVEVVTDGSVERRAWWCERENGLSVIVHDDATSRWRQTTITGAVDVVEGEVLPHEESLRGRWSASVLLPVSDGGLPLPLPASVGRVVHAPTQTEEPWGLPVVAIGDFRLDSSRRHVAEGARSDDVVAALATAYVSLVTDIAREHGRAALPLIPAADLVGTIDHLVRERVREGLLDARWVPRASGDELESPRRLVALEPSEPGLVRVLGDHLVDLADPDWVGDELRGLGLQTMPVNEVWDTLATLALSPEQWRAVYEAAQNVDRRALEGLPVPLADGRVVRGVRTAVLAGEQGAELALLGVDVVAPEAEHPLLERLGARPFEIARVLDLAFVRRVEDAVEHDESEALDLLRGAASLLTHSSVDAGELVQLGDVPVPTRNGSWAPASSVVLPGSALDAAVASDVPRLADDLAEAAPAHAWAALGVLRSLVPVTLVEQPLDPDLWDDVMLDGGDWCSAAADTVGVGDPGELLADEVSVVRGVELLDGLNLADIADLLGEPDVRRALVTPTTVVTADGRHVQVPSPSAWWLSEASVVDGRSPVEVRIPGDDRLAPFFPTIDPPAGLDGELLKAIGVHSTLERWISSPDGVDELLEAMGDTGVELAPALMGDLYDRLAVEVEGDLPDSPPRVRALVRGETAVVDADDAVVAIAPHHALVLRTPYVPGNTRLAEILDLAVSDDASCAAADISGTGSVRPAPVVPGVTGLPESYREHDELVVGEIPVDWWVTDDGEVHASTVEGLARALAWAGGQWPRRFEIAARLEHQEPATSFGVEGLYDR